MLTFLCIWLGVVSSVLTILWYKHAALLVQVRHLQIHHMATDMADVAEAMKNPPPKL